MKIISRNAKRPIVEFEGGRITAIITWSGAKASFSILTPELRGVRRRSLADFGEACRAMAKLIAGFQGKSVSLRGTWIDPDEPDITSGQNSTVVYKIFPKDDTQFMTFVRDAEDGSVKAYLPSKSFSDLPSLVQVASVATSAANLMLAYERLPNL